MFKRVFEDIARHLAGVGASPQAHTQSMAARARSGRGAA
jgi:hypothetical protein